MDALPLGVCAHCGAKVRPDRMEKHVRRVHQQIKTTPTPKKKGKSGGGKRSSPYIGGSGGNQRDWDFD